MADALALQMPRHEQVRVRELIAHKTEVDANGCWLWTGGKDRKGYGYVTVLGKLVKAHRASLAAFRGPIAEGALVLHSCDVPACVNPAHLRCGTPAENMQDKMDRGRGTPPPVFIGPANNNARLDEDKVRAIRAMRAAGDSYSVIAPRFGIDKTTVAQISTGKTWRHVT